MAFPNVALRSVSRISGLWDQLTRFGEGIICQSGGKGGKKVLSYEMFSLWPEWFKMPNGCIFVTVHFIAT